MKYNERRTYHRNWHRLLRAYEKKYLPKVLKALEGEADRFIKEAERIGFDAAFRTFGLVNERLLLVVNQLHKEVGTKFGREVDRQLSKTEKVSFFNANFILNLIEILTRQALDLLTAVETTTKDRILQILNRSQTEQLTFVDTARLITEQVASPERALTITRTESNRAANIAAFEAAKLKKYEVTKEWISSIDNRTRRFREKDEYDHALLDGRVQELDTPFEQIGRTKGIQAVAQYPLDAQAPAAFTINCRCVLGFEYKRDANDNLIPRGIYKPVVPGMQQMPKKPVFTTSNNNRETAENLRKYIEETTGLKISKLSLAEIDNQLFNEKAKQAAKLFDEYNLPDILNKEYGTTLEFKSSAIAYGSVTSNYTNKKRNIWNINFGSKSDTTSQRQFISGSDELRGKSAVDEKNISIATVTHEFAHILGVTSRKKNQPGDELFSDTQKEFFSDLKKMYKTYTTEVIGIARNPNIKYQDKNKVINEIYLGEYAETNLNEFMAEAFTEYKLKTNPSKYAKLVGELIDKYYKK